MTDREFLKYRGLTAHLMSFAKTVKQYKDGSKTVTRRGGPEPTWKKLKAGDLIEGIEWSPRVGQRWVCNLCGWFGPIRKSDAPVMISDDLRIVSRRTFEHPGCKGGGNFGWTACDYRAPRRIGLARVISVRPVRLVDISSEEVFSEGFPELSPYDFVELYSGKPYAQVSHWRVNRIEFRRISRDEL